MAGNVTEVFLDFVPNRMEKFNLLFSVSFGVVVAAVSYGWMSYTQKNTYSLVNASVHDNSPTK